MNINELNFDKRNANKHTQKGLKLLEKSLSKLGAARSIVLDKDNNIIAGNGVIEVAGQIGMNHIRVIETDGNEIVAVKRTDVSIDSKKGRELAIADNATAINSIDFDFDVITDLSNDFDLDLLKEWEVPAVDYSDKTKYLDKRYAPHLANHNNLHYVVFYKTTKKLADSETLENIKKDKNTIDILLPPVANYINDIFNNKKNVCILTTPSRSHAAKNGFHYSTLMCEYLSNICNIEFINDAITAKNKGKLAPIFTLEKEINYDNIILIDDIVTTGITLKTCNDLLADKNVFIFVLINNG